MNYFFPISIPGNDDWCGYNQHSNIILVKFAAFNFINVNVKTNHDLCQCCV